MSLPEKKTVWIFGYGSLLWNPHFDYYEKLLGHVNGWSRKFALVDTYHRGSPSSPGRCVTLIPSDDSTSTYG